MTYSETDVNNPRADHFGQKVDASNFSQCIMCARWEMGTCEAFPAGVPYAILANDHDHHKPFTGDNGILFKAIPHK